MPIKARRIAAAVLDCLFLGVAWWLLANILFILSFADSTPRIYWTPLLILPFGYVGIEVLRGASTGKYLLSLEVRTLRNEKLSSDQAFLRGAVKTTPFFLWILALFTRSETLVTIVLYLSLYMIVGMTVISMLLICIKGVSLCDIIARTQVIRIHKEARGFPLDV